MTAPSGYRRLIHRPDTHQARCWAWMRLRDAPWTVAELADASGASLRLARRYVERLAKAGYLEPQPETGGDGGRFAARQWLLARDTGPIAPALAGGAAGEGISDLNGNMSGAQLARVRNAAGLTLAQFAGAALDVRDQRTARRYEALDVVPAPVAERARAYARQHKLRIARGG